MGTLIWESISPNMVPVSRVVQRWFGGVRDTAFLTLDHKGRQTFLSSLHESIWEGPREALFGINRLNTASPLGLCFEKKKQKEILGSNLVQRRCLRQNHLTYQVKFTVLTNTGNCRTIIPTRKFLWLSMTKVSSNMPQGQPPVPSNQLFLLI